MHQISLYNCFWIQLESNDITILLLSYYRNEILWLERHTVMVIVYKNASKMKYLFILMGSLGYNSNEHPVGCQLSLNRNSFEVLLKSILCICAIDKLSVSSILSMRRTPSSISKHRKWFKQLRNESSESYVSLWWGYIRYTLIQICIDIAKNLSEHQIVIINDGR